MAGNTPKKSRKPRRLQKGTYVIPRAKAGCKVTVRFVIPKAKGC